MGPSVFHNGHLWEQEHASTTTCSHPVGKGCILEYLTGASQVGVMWFVHGCLFLSFVFAPAAP